MTDQDQTSARTRGERMRIPFVAAVALGSFLLFMVQPMVAHMALPRLGGSPAVWNSAMLVYQTLLLGGYAYAHVLGRLPARWQTRMHCALFVLAAAWLPIGLTDRMPTSGTDPVLWAPALIAMSIGPLFLIVASQAPLLQRWHAMGGRSDPYALYAASNLGSFAGLLAYPLVMEPFATTAVQRMIWSAGYLVLGGATLVAMTTMRRGASAIHEKRTAPPRAATYLRWMMIAAIPSGLMLSTTTYLTTDIVATPLLWVLPLGIYLLTFVAAFSGRDNLVEAAMRVAPLLVFVEGVLALSQGGRLPAVSVPLGLATLYAVGVALHGVMHRERPAADHLTGFYLAMSAGGALGGVACALVAPVVFDWVWEHPLLLLAACLAIPGQPLLARSTSDTRMAVAFIVMAVLATLSGVVAGPAVAMPALVLVCLMGGIGIAFVGNRWTTATCLLCAMIIQGAYASVAGGGIDSRFRSYFGSYRIVETGDARAILSGTTLHGMQKVRPAVSTTPLSYYGPTSGVASALGWVTRMHGPATRIGVVGLGVGSLACYAKPGQTWTFFEIDPQVIRMALDRSRFTFVSTCTPRASIVQGDARISIEAGPAKRFDALVIDAFSSDAIPIHLVTRQAFDAYARAVGPNGVVIAHISNRHLDLEPVMAAMRDWHPVIIRDVPTAPLMQRSSWVAMSRDPTIERRLRASDARWTSLRSRPGFAGWTDERASIIPFLKF